MRIIRTIIATLCGPALLACQDPANDAATNPDPGLTISSISTQPWMVSGGDVLLRIEAVGGDLAAPTITVNGVDVSGNFRPVFLESGSAITGLLTQLPEGISTVEARLPGRQPATLELHNYPITGPLISGPQQETYLCQTEQFRLVTGELAGAPLDANCSIETRIDYVYYSQQEQDFLPYAVGATDVGTVTTADGRELPFIVRVQTGTVNRAIYESAMLHDPQDAPPDPWHRSEGWNGRLVYTHGGGCRGGWYRQGSQTGGVLNEGLLRMGYAVTSSTLNVFGQNCNDLLASETHIMVKERFIESYGEPLFTIATGASGGSYQSHQTADNYPGVFDGIIVSASFPDVTSATIFTLADARLLHRYFTVTDPAQFSPGQQLAIAGFGQWGSIPNLSQGAARLDPTWSAEAAPEHQGGELRLPRLEAMRYSPGQAGGLRATVYDHTRNVYGTDPATGFAARPLDNTGVQYGLQALNDGVISPAQFLALNRDIGGFDMDLNHIGQRHRADPAATRHAFGSGRILWGGAGLATTPIIDYRSYTDDVERGDIHMKIHQHSTRARLLAANGHADNHVMAVGGRWGFTEDRPDLGELFQQMDEWLSAIVADNDDRDPVARMLRHRPDGLVDHCWDNTGEERVRIDEEQQVDGSGRCSDLYRAYPTPRHVAGAPLANDIVSCQLKALDAKDYGVSFSPDEWQSLQQIFPAGVCDWSTGDAFSTGYYGTWRSFGPVPVNLVQAVAD